MSQSGKVAVLNVGAGDIKLSFDPKNPAERIRAARIVKDMLRRGCALLVEVERDGVKAYERALDFDESHCEYIVADYDPTVTAPIEPAQEAPHAEEPKPKKQSKRRLKAETTNAVSVARSAGG